MEEQIVIESVVNRNLKKIFKIIIIACIVTALFCAFIGICVGASKKILWKISRLVLRIIFRVHVFQAMLQKKKVIAYGGRWIVLFSLTYLRSYIASDPVA